MTEPEPNPDAAALVAEIREEVVKIFTKHGAASNQIGKTYPYFDSLRPENQRVMGGIKKMLDPDGQVNPETLGFK